MYRKVLFLLDSEALNVRSRSQDASTGSIDSSFSVGGKTPFKNANYFVLIDEYLNM